MILAVLKHALVMVGIGIVDVVDLMMVSRLFGFFYMFSCKAWTTLYLSSV